MLYYISKRHRTWHLIHISYRFRFYHSENMQSQLLFTEGKQWSLLRKERRWVLLSIFEYCSASGVKIVMLIMNVIPMYDKSWFEYLLSRVVIISFAGLVTSLMVNLFTKCIYNAKYMGRYPNSLMIILVIFRTVAFCCSSLLNRFPELFTTPESSPKRWLSTTGRVRNVLNGKTTYCQCL